MTSEATPTHLENAESNSESAEFPSWLREAAQLGGSLPAPAGRDLVGASLCGGRFEVRRLLGRGGMGQVYEALDRRSETLVALKTLQRITPSGIYRLKREFRALSGVRHENLVRMFELFEDAGCWFFTMELVRGVPLDAYLKQFTSEQTLRLLLGQLLAGVAALHAAGKIHRDLKPSNVLINEQDRLTILDFGLVSESARAALVDGDTLEGAIVGTPAYMAPEQCLGQHTAASDMYALGLILFHVLAFEKPFSASVDPVFTFRNQDGPAPSSLRSGVPADLDHLCEALLRLDPARRPTATQAQTVLPPQVERARASSPGRAGQVLLLGREEQCDQLTSALELAARGVPQVVLVEGPSGIGKSALMAHFANHARLARRAITFEGSCYENESVPYKGVEAIVDEIARYLRGEGEQEALIPVGIPALARVFPTLGRVEAVARRLASFPVVGDEQALREEAFLCLRELLVRFSLQQPLVICLDDAQWADEDTAALLGYVLSSPSAPRVLFVATCRTDSVQNGFVRRFMGACKVNHVEVQRIALQPLPAAAAEKLVSSLLSDPVRSALVLEEARGHPFLIQEYCRFFCDPHQGPAPVSLSAVLLARMASLGAPAKALVELVALAATPLQRTTLLYALGAPEELEFEGTLARLFDERLLRPCGGSERDSLVCYHDRVRAAVRDSLDDAARMVLHEQLTDALRATNCNDFEALAYHSAGAGRLVEAASLAERAGDGAMGSLAFHRAASWYRDGLRWGKEVDRLRVKLAQALAKAGHGAAAADTYLHSASEQVDVRRAYELRTLAAEQYLVTGHYRQGTRLLSRLLGEGNLAAPGNPFALRLRYLLERCRLKWELLRRGDFPARRAPTAALQFEAPLQALDTVTRQGLEVCRVAACTFGVSDIVQGATYATQYLRLALAAGDASHVLHALGTELAAVASAGPRARLRVWQLTLFAQSWRSQANAAALAYFDAACGAANILMGDFAVGARQTERAELELRTRCTGVTWELNIARTFMAIAWVATGELRLLSERVPQWLRDAQERSDLYAATHLRLTLPLALLATDDVPGAEVAVREAEQTWRADSFDQAALNICDVRTGIELYRGADAAVLEDLSARYRRALRTPLAYAHGNRVFSRYFAGCCELGLLDLGRSSAGALQRVTRHARALRQDRAAYARGYGALLGAAVWWRRGNPARTFAELETASLELQSAGVALAAAAAKHRLGLVLGERAGGALVVEATEALLARGVVWPARFADALVPGFGSRSAGA